MEPDPLPCWTEALASRSHPINVSWTSTGITSYAFYYRSITPIFFPKRPAGFVLIRCKALGDSVASCSTDLLLLFSLQEVNVKRKLWVGVYDICVHDWEANAEREEAHRKTRLFMAYFSRVFASWAIFPSRGEERPLSVSGSGFAVKEAPEALTGRPEVRWQERRKSMGSSSMQPRCHAELAFKANHRHHLSLEWREVAVERM